MRIRTYPPDLFTPRPPERERAVSVLDRMADERRAWLERMRSEMAGLFLLRVEAWGNNSAFVTADDARLLMEGRPDLALPAGASTNLVGALFKGGHWSRSYHRDHISNTPNSHGNDLYRWRYVGRKAA